MKVEFIGAVNKAQQNFPSHSHNMWEIVVYLEGKGKHIVGDCIIPFQKGTIICQPPNVAHSALIEGKFRDMHMVVSDFTPPNNEAVPVFFDDEENQFVILFKFAYKAFYKKEKNYNVLVNTLFEAMYQLMISWSGDKLRNNDIELLRTKIVNNISNIYFDITEEIFLTNYCPDHLRRLFKRYVGLTPSAYLTQLRIDYAKKLINNKGYSLTIKEISLLAGFNDSYYFSRVFKKKTGISPTVYLKSVFDTQ